MAGALAERDFVEKLEKAGFGDIHVVERRPFGVDDCARYPLFTPELVALMRRLIDPARQTSVATAITLKAVKISP